MTHYQVLGVARDADSAAIRAAYLALIKRYHPDKKAAEQSEEIYWINSAYSVLRDAASRAEYDSRLSADVLQLGHGFGSRIQPRLTPDFELDRSRLRLVLTLAVAAFLIVLVPGDTLVGGGSYARAFDDVANVSERLLWAGSHRDSLPRSQPDLDLGIRLRAEIASYASLDEAVDLSRHCFARLRHSPSVALADRCIAFDLAFAFWHDGEFRGHSTEKHFLPSAMNRRHTESLSLAGIGDPTARIAAIKGQTFASISAILTSRGQAILSSNIPNEESYD